MSDLVEERRSFAILIDALNVAYWCGDPPSLRLPLALVAALLERRVPVRLYFDASARYRLVADAGLYAQLLQQTPIFIEVPSGRRADGEMLRYARTHGACMVSRDRFRDYRSRYRRLIDDPARRIEGAVEEEALRLPALGLRVPVPASAQEAWDEVRARLHPGAPA